MASRAAIPATAIVARTTLSFSLSSELRAAVSRARSIKSPPTRAQSHRTGRSLDRMPIPATISRSPTTCISVRFRSSSSTPIMRFIVPGEATCAIPRPILNQPSPLATRGITPLSAPSFAENPSQYRHCWGVGVHRSDSIRCLCGYCWYDMQSPLACLPDAHPSQNKGGILIDGSKGAEFEESI